MKAYIVLDEMPKSCSGCMLFSWGWCYATNNKVWNGQYDATQERPEWCPLKEERRGHWAIKNNGLYCSRCDNKGGHKLAVFFPYCPNCGADMRGEHDG